MNKKEYLFELERALKSAHIAESQEILDEYNEHFELKKHDGYSEEEICARLLPPKELASQYAGIKQSSANKFGKIASRISLVITDIFTAAFFGILYVWVAVLGVTGVAFASGGVFSFTGLNAQKSGVFFWPDMPYFCAPLVGITFLSLALLSFLGTQYCYLYITQLLRVYFRWHKTIWGDAVFSPPISLQLPITHKKRRTLRTLTLASLLVSLCGMALTLVVMMIAAGSFEPWHVWNWFVSI